jgi:nucleoside-diphosphate-sugar epimerase
MKRVLITGGSGFLGINLARYLDKLGYKIRVLDFAPFDYPDMKDKIEYVEGDIRNKADVEKAVEGCDFVVHTAAALPLYKPRVIYDTDIGGTRNVVRACEKFNVERVVHISSTAVYGVPDHHPLFEHDKMIGVGPYGECKVLAEKICETYRKRGMCISVLRPKSFIGPERLGVMAIYYDWIHRGKSVPIVGMGNNKYQLLHVEDLCNAIYLCMTEDKKKANDTFNVGAKIYTTMKEDFGAIFKHIGSKKGIVPIPAKPLIWALRFLEMLNLSPLYKWVYETAPEDSFVSIDKIQKQLGWNPKYSNKEALIENYEWYKAHLSEFEGSEGISHRAPWKQGILKFFSWFF